MALLNYVPFLRHNNDAVSEKLDLADAKDVKALMKIGSLALGRNGFSNSSYSYGRKNFESPDSDFDRINKAIDTDSYAKQAMGKYEDLFWKEGWDLVSENNEAVDYLWQRIGLLEMAMGRSFQGFISEAVDQWLRFSNVFIVKARGNIGPFFPGKLRPQKGEDPIIGYYILPTETVEILRDKHNRPIRYRQNTSLAESVFSKKRMPSWPAEDVIHIHLDRKPGRAFGTPFMSSSFEDIVALRQMEEDIQNLVHRELFPLYVYQIGTDDLPASKDEIDKAEIELENMRSESGLIIPNRHNIDVLGGNDNILDASPYLSHFKERVAVGLGVFPHHLGMSMEGGNRAMTDRLDSALFDKVKRYQRTYSDAMRFGILNELLVEGGYDPFMPMNAKGKSDRCEMRFNEIDVDTQVKKESHVIQKWTADLITSDEARLAMHMKPEMDEDATHAAFASRIEPQLPVNTPIPKKDPKGKSKGAAKTAKNVIRPANQHGTRTSPNIRHTRNSYDMLTEAVELLSDMNDDIGENTDAGIER